MAKFTRSEQIIAFYIRGLNCIQSGEALFNSTKTPDPNKPYDILLIHGIELILAAYIMANDASVVDAKAVYSKFHHLYGKMYKECQKLDTANIVFQDKELTDHVLHLADAYAPSVIEVRFPSESGLMSFPTKIFEVLKEKLIAPLKNLTS